MNEWKECKLGDLVTSNNRSVGKDYPYQLIQYLDTGSITGGEIDSLQEIDLKSAPSRAKRLVKKNDIVYSTVRPIQRHFGYMTDPISNLVVSTGFSVIEANPVLAESLFIYYFLTSGETVETLDVIAEGSTSAYPSLKPSDIENLEISIPPLPEQKAIASVLSSLDDKIDLLHRQNTTLEAMAETLFRQWFVEEAQDDWDGCMLGKLANIKGGKRLPKGSTLSEIPSLHPYIRTKDIHENKIKIKELLFVPEDVFPFISRYTVEQNDIIISIVGTIGLCVIIPEELHLANLTENCAKIVNIKENVLDRFYLFYYLISSHGQSEIEDRHVGSTQPKLPLYNIEKLQIPIPPPPKQKAFRSAVSSFNNKIQANQLQIQKLEQLRDTLLPKLMKGEVRVNYE